MNILHLVSNKVWGGGERYALDLCLEMERRGHSCAVITRHGVPAVDAPFQAAGIAVGHLPLRGALDFISPSKLSRVLSAMELPVAVHVHNFKDALVALRARKLMRAGGRGVRIVCTRHLVRPAKTSSLERGIYRELDALIFVSDCARRVFLSKAPAELLDSPRILTVHNSVSAPDPAPGKADCDKLRFIYVGRISPEKGVDVLVDAFAKVESLRPGRASLRVCGTGDSRVAMPIVRRARGLDVEKKIEWLGHVPDVYPELSASDAVVVPTRAPEAFGLAALEGMSQGLPAIGTSGGALPEIIRDGIDGLIVPPGDAEALAQAMLRLIDNPGDASAMGRNARRRAAEDFSFSSFADKIESIYRGSDAAAENIQP